MKKYKFIRYIEFNYLFELFFLSAILSVICIRLYLHFTGYPQVAFGGIHIAHMLWGGMFMMVAVLLLLAFLNDTIKPYAAILGGIGFGTFIDELGKFITSDNNYFFQPTFAIIYIIFIYIYLFYRTLEGRQKFSKDEYLVNSLDKLKEVIINDLDVIEQKQALMYLSKSNQKDPIAQFLKKTFEDIKNLQPESVGMYERFRAQIFKLYNHLISKKWFLNGVIVIFVLRAIFYLFEGVQVGISVGTAVINRNVHKLSSAHNIFNSIEFFAISIQALLIIAGALTIRKDRRAAYVYFKNSVLLSILVIQIFNFYQDPLVALMFTLGDIILYAILSYMINSEDKS